MLGVLGNGDWTSVFWSDNHWRNLIYKQEVLNKFKESLFHVPSSKKFSNVWNQYLKYNYCPTLKIFETFHLWGPHPLGVSPNTQDAIARTNHHLDKPSLQYHFCLMVPESNPHCLWQKHRAQGPEHLKGFSVVNDWESVRSEGFVAQIWGFKVPVPMSCFEETQQKKRKLSKSCFCWSLQPLTTALYHNYDIL